MEGSARKLTLRWTVAVYASAIVASATMRMSSFIRYLWKQSTADMRWEIKGRYEAAGRNATWNINKRDDFPLRGV